MKMKFFTGALVVATMLSSTTVKADPINFNPIGGGAGGAKLVNTFDFLPGNTLAVNSVPLSTDPKNPTQLYTLFQAKLGSITDTNGNTIFAYGGGGITTSEITAVLRIGEFGTRTIIPGVGEVATFKLDPSQPTFLEYYYDTTPDSNNLEGTGFNDGVKILSAQVSNIKNGSFFVSYGADGKTPALDTFDKNGVNNYPGIQTVVGAGSVDFSAQVTYANSAFFTDQLIGLVIDMNLLNSSNITPFNQADPSKRFVTTANGGFGSGPAPVLLGAGNGSIGSVNGFNGTDFQFQADANSSFTVVPEPTSMVLAGLGFGAMGLVRVLRRRKTAKA